VTDLRDATESEALASDFARDVRKLMPDLLKYFLRRIDPRDDAADCLSDTLVVLWRRKGRAPTDADAFRAWSFGIARNVAANQRRQQRRRSDLATRLRNELSVYQPEGSDHGADLHAALETLSSDDRELVTLVAWDGFGVAEAGAALGLKAEASRARYSRARARLREILSE